MQKRLDILGPVCGWWLPAVLACALLGGVARAQVPATTQPTFDEWGGRLARPAPPATQPTAQPTEGSDRPLAERQDVVHENLRRLEDRMVKLAQLLAESEPEQSQRLLEALNRAGETHVRERLAEISVLLRDLKLSDADFAQQQALTDLKALLAVLTSNESDLERLRLERQRLERLHQSVQGLFKDQMQRRMALDQRTAAAAAAAALDAMATQLEQLADQQRDLREGVASPPPTAPAPETSAANPQASGGATSRPTGAGATSRPTGAEPTSRPAASATSRPTAGATSRSADARAAQAELERATRAAGSELERIGESVPNAPVEDIEAAQRDVNAAAEAMQAAAQRMAAEGSEASPPTTTAPSGAAAAQSQAENDLREAAARLRQEQQRQQAENDLREHAKAQRDIQRRTQDVEREMQPPQSGPQATPGARQVGQAGQNMQQAGQRLSDEQPQEAGQQQEEALKNLQDALDELDDALRQVRREERDEMLAALEARFKSMLTREREVRAVEQPLSARAIETWDHSEHLKLADAAEKHSGVVTDAEAALRLLRDEGTTLVLPDLVTQVLADMRTVATALGSEDATPATDAVLADVITQLEEIVGALAVEREKMQSGQSGGGGGGQGDRTEPLLPGSAELKLLRAAQVRVNTRTTQLAGDPATAATPRFRQLSDRQQVLSKLTQRMIERQ